MDRRTFLANVGLAATWAAIGIKITACSDDDEYGGTAPGPTCAETGAVSVVSAHDHTGACLTEAQLIAGSAVVLTLTGNGHTHSASLTAQEVQLIAGGTQVQVQSSNVNAHQHTVTFN
jgi:hypothetical protein